MFDKRKIKLLVMDVDGTLTDGKIYMGAEGEIMKAFDVKDGCGIKDILPRFGIQPAIITARSSRILENRCGELGISLLFQGVRGKIEKLDEILASLSGAGDEPLGYENVAYIGDDILDLQCMEPIKAGGGVAACPADAAAPVLAVSDYVCSRKGGDGAVREFIEWLTEI